MYIEISIMSIEFRLKFIRETIDKSINESLLKWNARKVFLNESFDEEDMKDICPACMGTGKQRLLKYFYVNMDEAVYKCESTACLYPFRNFKYKNYVDRTIFRYERVMATENSCSEQKIFTSPTKIESDDMDHFNLNWLDNSFTDDLGSILTTPSEGKTFDIKEIINNICDNAGSASTTFNSPSRRRSEPSTNAPAPKLSKCLQYIEDLSPTKLPHSKKIETMTSTRRIALDCSKSLKKVRLGFKHNQEINLVQPFIVEQKPLGLIDWLDVVSKMDPKQMKEFEFASPAEFNSSGENQNNTGKSSDPSNTQSVLIELMGAPSLDGNKLPNSEPCLLYELDPSELQTTKSHCETVSNVHLEYPITTQTLENILTGDQDDVDPTNVTNVEQSTPVIGDSFSTDFQIIKTKIGAGSDRSQKTHNTLRAKVKAEIKNKIKSKPRNERKKGKAEKKKLKQQKSKEIKQVERKEIKINTETFDIEAEDKFCGFEPLEPFKPITLRRMPLLWLKIE